MTIQLNGKTPHPQVVEAFTVGKTAHDMAKKYNGRHISDGDALSMQERVNRLKADVDELFYEALRVRDQHERTVDSSVKAVDELLAAIMPLVLWFVEIEGHRAAEDQARGHDHPELSADTVLVRTAVGPSVVTAGDMARLLSVIEAVRPGSLSSVRASSDSR